jgi:magnesium chelatase family protein
MAKISGPLLDRIDLHAEVPALKYEELKGKEPGECSATIRGRVLSARELQRKRFEGRNGIYCNADMRSNELQAFCGLDASGEGLLRDAMRKLGLSARAFDRILKVARTIADLGQSGNIRTEHISEAIQYRSLDRILWQA